MPPGTWQERSWISLAWNTDPLRDGRVWKQMESYREIEKSLLGRKITARLQFLDEGLNVLLTGGEKSHIGAVSGRVPGQEPVDIELPGHREGNLAAQWAEELYRTWEMPVWVECGIHYENLSKEGIRQVLDVCREMLEEILAERLENNYSEWPGADL